MGQVVVGGGSWARLVADVNWGAMDSVAAQLVLLADQDPVTAAELFGLVAADPELVLRLDTLARDRRLLGPDHRWPDLARDRLERQLAAAGPTVAALASLHSDGRVREHAVTVMIEPEALIKNAHGLIPFLVLRTTDWAAPVREAARAGLVVLLDRRSDLLFPAAKAALRLARRARSDFALTQVHAAVAIASEEVFAGFLTSNQPEVRRLAAAFSDRITGGDLALRARTETDRIARTRLTEGAARAAAQTGRHQNIEPLLASAHPDVRAAGVMALVRAGFGPQAVSYLADPDKAVRAVARAASHHCGIDVSQRYRDLAGMPGVNPGVLYGLAESADRSPDGEVRAVIETCLADPRPRVRAAAIGALDMVGGLDRERLLGLLHDPASRVVRAAAHRLEPDASSLDPGPLLALLADPRRTPSARNCIYTLAGRRSDEAKLGTALTALAAADQSLAARAANDLRRMAVISVLSTPAWQQSDLTYRLYLERFRIDRTIVPDLKERFAAARPHLDPATCGALEAMFELYWR